MAGGFIVTRYDNVSTGPCDDIMCIVVCSPGILVNAEISVIELSWFTAASCSCKVCVLD